MTWKLKLTANLKREVLTVGILFIGILAVQWSSFVASALGVADISPILFKIGMGAIVVSLWRWVLRLLMPWFRAHLAFEEALHKQNTAASIVLLSYVMLLMTSWWLASIQ